MEAISPARAHALQVYEVPLLRAQSCWPCTADKRGAPVARGDGAGRTGTGTSPVTALSEPVCVSRCLASVEASARARSQSRTVRRTQPHIHEPSHPSAHIPNRQRSQNRFQIRRRPSNQASPVGRRAHAPLQASIKLKGAPSPTAEHRSARIGGHDWQGLYIPSRPWHVDMLSNIWRQCVCVTV